MAELPRRPVHPRLCGACRPGRHRPCSQNDRGPVEGDSGQRVGPDGAAPSPAAMQLGTEQRRGLADTEVGQLGGNDQAHPARSVRAAHSAVRWPPRIPARGDRRPCRRAPRARRRPGSRAREPPARMQEVLVQRRGPQRTRPRHPRRGRIHMGHVAGWPRRGAPPRAAPASASSASAPPTPCSGRRTGRSSPTSLGRRSADAAARRGAATAGDVPRQRLLSRCLGRRQARGTHAPLERAPRPGRAPPRPNAGEASA